MIAALWPRVPLALRCWAGSPPVLGRWVWSLPVPARLEVLRLGPRPFWGAGTEPANPAVIYGTPVVLRLSVWKPVSNFCPSGCSSQSPNWHVDVIQLAESVNASRCYSWRCHRWSCRACGHCLPVPLLEKTEVQGRF